MNEKFSPILDDEEIIIKTYLPNKKKVYTSNLLIISLSLIIACALISIAMFVPEEGYEPCPPIFWLIPAGIFVLGILITTLLTSLWLNKTVYAVTNTRIIMRTGVIGVDFKSLDLKSIGATEVYVSFIDKILGGKTGSIRFGSMSSPINSQTATPYGFSSVLEPYKSYKEIKEHIQKVKEI